MLELQDINSQLRNSGFFHTILFFHNSNFVTAIVFTSCNFDSVTCNCMFISCNSEKNGQNCEIKKSQLPEKSFHTFLLL